jgi:hypothetical protein
MRSTCSWTESARSPAGIPVDGSCSSMPHISPLPRTSRTHGSDSVLASVGAATFESLGAIGILAPTLVFVFFNLFLSIFMERAITGFKPLQPTFCSIYDIRFWKHERFWRFIGGAAGMFNGTP